jgi:hypothetical protein
MLQSTVLVAILSSHRCSSDFCVMWNEWSQEFGLENKHQLLFQSAWHHHGTSIMISCDDWPHQMITFRNCQRQLSAQHETTMLFYQLKKYQMSSTTCYYR